MKSKSKCMENVWEKMFNWIFSNEATVEFKFVVRLSCRARRAISGNLRQFLNPSSKFREKLKIKTFIIKNVLDVTLLSTFESEVSVWAQIFLLQKYSARRALQKCLWGQLLSVYLQRWYFCSYTFYFYIWF